MTDFYDDLAGTYDRIYADWWSAAVRTGEVLARLLKGVTPPAAILDCTCGIGTQALPLSAKGFRVVGTDLSGRSIERARAEAAARGLDVEFQQADVRDIPELGEFDAVISCDNSLPHLLTDEDLGQALTSIRRRLRPGGLFLATIRDYDQILRDGIQGVPPRIHGTGRDRRIIAQAWEWAEDNRTLTLNHIMLTQTGTGWDTAVRTTTYRALRRTELDTALQTAGFTAIQWTFPDDSGYYQPVVTARAPG